MSAFYRKFPLIITFITNGHVVFTNVELVWDLSKHGVHYRINFGIYHALKGVILIQH